MNEADYKRLGFGQPAIWIDFLNSLEQNGLGDTRDHLRDPGWRKAFFSHWKLGAPARPSVPLPSLERLRGLLRQIADALSLKRPLRPKELHALNDALSVFVRPQLIQRQNGFALQEVPGKNDWRWIAAQIARSCAETLAHRPLDRLKICPDPKCRWVFYDQTKAKSRIWCNEKTCGNRNRVRRARAV